MNTFPRKVVISCGYNPWGSSFSEHMYEVAEYPPFVEYVSNKGCDGDVIIEILRGIDGLDIEDIYLGDNPKLHVVEVSGPYVIEDYDGGEYVVERSQMKWRF